jgi:hypothetical protein
MHAHVRNNSDTALRERPRPRWRALRASLLIATSAVMVVAGDVVVAGNVAATPDEPMRSQLIDPTPRSSLEPTRTAASGTRACPFARPETRRTVTVPGSIDRTGGSNAAGALNRFIASVPDGSVIDFARPGAVYRLDAGLLLSGRRNLVLLGHGSTTLRIHGNGSDEALSAFLLRGSSHIRIRGFKVVGSHPDWPANRGERAHVLGLSGWYRAAPSHYVELSNVTASRIFGDAVYLEGENEGTQRPSTNVCIHDNTFDYVGRNGISLINVTDVLIKHNRFNHVAYHAIDIEPNFAAEEVRRVRIRDNVFGSYSHRSGLLGYFVADAQIGSGVGAAVTGITIADNRVDGIAANGYDGTPLGLDSKFLGSSGKRHARISFTGNRSSRTVSGRGIIYCSWVDGFTVARNVQPMSSGTFVLRSNCSSVTGAR